MESKRALIIEPIHRVFLEKLDAMGYEYTIVKTLSKNEALAMMGDYTGLVTSNKLYVDKEIIDAGIHLKWIGRMGSGMEIIDVNYATSKGIKCISSPEGNANAVAEQALGMLLSLLHNVKKSNDELKKGIWLRDENRGTELSGLKVGIVGYGNNGRLFGEKLMLLGCRVYYYDPYISKVKGENLECCESYEQLLTQVDVLSFHVPINEETYHYFNKASLNYLTKSIYLINLSRGNVLDLRAVLFGLEQHQLLGVAIDVWPEEPIFSSTGDNMHLYNDLLQQYNFIGTSHIGGYSHQATYKMSKVLAEKIEKII